MTFIRFLAPLLAASVGFAAEVRVPPVPAGDVEMKVDGQLQPGEWEGAEELTLSGGGVLKLKQTDGRVWLAIRPDAKHATYVDLFLQDGDGVVHNLHASLQWGQRIVAGEAWTDREPATEWGLPLHWLANRIEWARGGREAPEVTRASFKPYTAHEFWISRQHYPGATWKVRLEIRDFAGKVSDVVVPAQSSRFQPDGWLHWRLE